ncbi:MAG: VOC family protein, partial [Dehalococcoidia bacterium]|nr:VOC family protein [Dehalococcoidia bacterium]
DIDKTLEYFKSLGIFRLPNQEPYTMASAKVAVKGVSVYLGNLWIEIWQPVKGDTVQQQFLDAHGEGINHVGFSVPDIEKARSIMAAKDIPVAFNIKNTATYYQTDKVGNVLIEIHTVQSIQKEA